MSNKIIGFKFESGTDNVEWFDQKEAYIGEVGTITYRGSKFASVAFEDGRTWSYPVSLIDSFKVSSPEDDRLDEIARRACAGHEESTSYHHMIEACLRMAELVLERLELDEK
jgi:hypothetical protein